VCKSPCSPPALLQPRLVSTISRLPRIDVEYGVYHVVARGDERRAIFADDADRERFLELLGSSSAATACTCSPTV